MATCRHYFDAFSEKQLGHKFSHISAGQEGSEGHDYGREINGTRWELRGGFGWEPEKLYNKVTQVVTRPWHPWPWIIPRFLWTGFLFDECCWSFFGLHVNKLGALRKGTVSGSVSGTRGTCKMSYDGETCANTAELHTSELRPLSDLSQRCWATVRFSMDLDPGYGFPHRSQFFKLWATIRDRCG